MSSVYESLQEVYLKSPTSVENWESIAKPIGGKVAHVVGAIDDGKQVHIECPKKSEVFTIITKIFLVLSFQIHVMQITASLQLKLVNMAATLFYFYQIWFATSLLPSRSLEITFSHSHHGIWSVTGV